MRGVVRLEFERIFCNKRNLVFLVLFIAITIFFVNAGIVDYYSFNQNEKVFLDYEKAKVSRFIYYDQYGGLGFRILFKPSPLSIFFDKYNLLHILESNIDVSEVIKPIKIYKGRALFKDGNWKDFAGIIFFIGSLYMMFMGLFNFRSKKLQEYIFSKMDNLISVFSRLLFLNLIFGAIFLINYFFVKIRGISLSDSETEIFFAYSLYAMAFLTFFYLAGLFVSTVIKFRSVTIALLLWATFIFFLPEISKTNIYNRSMKIPPNESLNLTKISTLMDAQKQINRKVQEYEKLGKDQQEILKLRLQESIGFWTEGHKENKKREADFHRSVYNLIGEYKRNSTFFPTLFYSYFSKEISSEGYFNYLDFYKYIIDTRDKFIEFYVNKRYILREQEIEPFIKGDENVFSAQSRLPDNFGTGLWLTVLYSLMLFIVSVLALHFRLKKKAGEEERFDINLGELEVNRTYFILCRNGYYRDKLFSQLSPEPGVLPIERINPEDIDLELEPRRIFTYLCRIKRVKDRKLAADFLNGLGGHDVLARKRSEMEPEDLAKIYLAVKLAAFQDYETILFNETIARASRSFERNFLAIMKEFSQYNKRVIYLSDELYVNLALANCKEVLTSLGFNVIDITQKEVSLR